MYCAAKASAVASTKKAIIEALSVAGVPPTAKKINKLDDALLGVIACDKIKVPSVI